MSYDMFASQIRKFMPSDVNYVLKTWLRDMAYHKPKHYPDRLFYNNKQLVILELSKRSTLFIACDPKDPNFIHGFAAGKMFPDTGTLVVHYAFVRQEFRRLGIARRLLQALGAVEGETEIVGTHNSPTIDRFKRKDIIINPDVIFEVAR